MSYNVDFDPTLVTWTHTGSSAHVEKHTAKPNCYCKMVRTSSMQYLLACIKGDRQCFAIEKDTLCKECFEECTLLALIMSTQTNCGRKCASQAEIMWTTADERSYAFSHSTHLYTLWLVGSRSKHSVDNQLHEQGKALVLLNWSLSCRSWQLK